MTEELEEQSTLNESLESDDSDESVTASELLQSFEGIWLNEKFAPEILPNKLEVVECLYLQIEEMEKNIETLPKNDYKRTSHEMELKRIRYMLSNYLKTRLLKIEIYAQDILEQEEARRNNDEEIYLSASETAFLMSFKNITDKYMSDMFSFIPGYVQDESKEHPIRPNMYSFVFFKSKNQINGVVVNPENMHDDTVDINLGSKMIMSYNSIKNLLRDNEIQLI